MNCHAIRDKGRPERRSEPTDAAHDAQTVKTANEFDQITLGSADGSGMAVLRYMKNSHREATPGHPADLNADALACYAGHIAHLSRLAARFGRAATVCPGACRQRVDSPSPATE